MRRQYELRSTLLALTVVACGRIDVDLLPAAGNTDTDAQAGNGVEDASSPFDEAGAPVDDASAAPEDAGTIPEDAGATLADASTPAQPDAGVTPIPPNIEIDAGTDAATADAGAGAPDAAAPDAAAPNLDAALADAATTDGSTPPQLDAAAPDASAADAAMAPPDAGTDAATLPCAGKVVSNLCWYLGALGASCTNVCSSHGGYDVNATSYVGTSSQGGNLANCHLVLSALGKTATVTAGMRSDSLGLGCHIWSDGQPWWLASPATNPDSAIPSAQIACGCTR